MLIPAVREDLCLDYANTLAWRGGASPAPRVDDFAALRAAVAAAPARRQVARADGRYAWQIERLRPAAPDLLAPILWSAADLLLNADHRRIRQCANPKCLWLF